MYIFLSVVYVAICLFLIMVVLLQQGRGGMGTALGGGGQTVFGGSGAGNFLTRLTTISAAMFMILSATLAWMSSSGDSALEEAIQQREHANQESLREAAEHSEHDSTTPTPSTEDSPSSAPSLEEPSLEEPSVGDPSLEAPSLEVPAPSGPATSAPSVAPADQPSGEPPPSPPPTPLL